AILSGNPWAPRRRTPTGVSSVRSGCVPFEIGSTRLPLLPAMSRRSSPGAIIASRCAATPKGARRARSALLGDGVDLAQRLVEAGRFHGLHEGQIEARLARPAPVPA